MEAWNQVCGVTVMQQSTERQWILGIWVCVCVLAASTVLSPHLFMYYVWVAAGSDGPTTRGSHAANLSRPERLLLPCKRRRAERSVPGCRLPIRATRVRVHLQLFPTKCRLENFCLRLYFSILFIFFLGFFFLLQCLDTQQNPGSDWQTAQLPFVFFFFKPFKSQMGHNYFLLNKVWVYS